MRRLVLVSIALLVVAAACGQSQSPTSSELVLGAIYPLSGSQAQGGKEELAGVKAALQLAESSGAIKTKVRLDVVDATTPEAATAAVDHLVRDDHVPAIFGTYGSSLGRMAVTFTNEVLIPSYHLQAPRVVVIQVGDVYGRSVGGGEVALAAKLGVSVADVVEYNPYAYDADAIAARVAAMHPDFVWDVSYLDDGVAIWQALLRDHVALKGAIGTSSAFCMPDFGRRLGSGAVGVYAADKPDGDISSAAISPAGRALLDEARSVYARTNGGASMSIPALAGLVGGWTLFHAVLGALPTSVSSESIRAAALNVDVPVGDSVNGGGVRFGAAGSLDEGQNTRAAAVVGQWQAVGVMRVVYPSAYATGSPQLSVQSP